MSHNEERFEIDPQSAAKKPMSTGIKVLLALTGIGAIGMLLCCGGVYWMSTRAMQQTTVPAEVVEATRKIAEIAIPDSFEPQSAVSMNLVMMQSDVVNYARKDASGGETGQLMLMQMKLPGSQSAEQMKEAFRDQPLNPQPPKEISKDQSEIRTFEIDGTPCQFEFVTGKDSQSGVQTHSVTGMFPGRGGMAMLTIMEDDSQWNEEEVVKIIESISTK